YTAWVTGPRGSSPAESLVLDITNPRFHLWYVPVLLWAIVLLWAVAPFRRARLAAGAVALAATVIYTSPLAGMWGIVPNFDERYLTCVLYVWLGVALRQGWLPAPRGLVLPSVAAVAGAAVYLYGFLAGSWWTAGGRLVLTVGLCLALPAVLRLMERPVRGLVPVTNIIGTYSLWIYPLHPFITNGWVGAGSRAHEVLGGAALTVGVLAASVLLGWGWQSLTSRSAARAALSGGLMPVAAGAPAVTSPAGPAATAPAQSSALAPR
ncbi:MAG: acyltransferase family protein, partial [Demequina sp.]|uniref:acyltransferase family protein n=1 Tax=Demequina sp. TaxID=2050685 RepID=UPI003A891463